MDANIPVLELAQALADPLRLAILQSLMSGPATVSELMSLSGATQSNVSNHLALLRERGLVRATRQGRQMVYELRDASVGQLVESLAQVAGAPPSPAVQTSAPLVRARTCYDHLAGRLGVALFDALVARGALQSPAAARGPLELGPAAAEVFGAFGIDLAALRRERRKFATACLDWTERRPHLGGALGAALWAECVARGWVVRQPDTRAIILTDAGEQGLRDLLAVELQERVA
ncbi:MAG TPA: metalloregulator ArsR/SmtB family transcription factor [Ktedonobacterales bacterium]